MYYKKKENRRMGSEEKRSGEKEKIRNNKMRSFHTERINGFVYKQVLQFAFPI